jgi:hypothetical protein
MVPVCASNDSASISAKASRNEPDTVPDVPPEALLPEVVIPPEVAAPDVPPDVVLPEVVPPELTTPLDVPGAPELA